MDYDITRVGKDGWHEGEYLTLARNPGIEAMTEMYLFLCFICGLFRRYCIVTKPLLRV